MSIQLPTARLVWRNVSAQLGAAGMTVANLVKVTIFLSSREFATGNREIRQEVLGAHSPALTVIITSSRASVRGYLTIVV